MEAPFSFEDGVAGCPKLIHSASNLLTSINLKPRQLRTAFNSPRSPKPSWEFPSWLLLQHLPRCIEFQNPGSCSLYCTICNYKGSWLNSLPVALEDPWFLQVSAARDGFEQQRPTCLAFGSGCRDTFRTDQRFSTNRLTILLAARLATAFPMKSNEIQVSCSSGDSDHLWR